MELCDVSLNNPDLFDKSVHGDDGTPSLPSGNDIAIITKDGGMTSGRAAAVITWTCEVDGKLRRAQYSIPVRALKVALRLIDAAYNDDGFPR